MRTCGDTFPQRASGNSGQDERGGRDGGSVFLARGADEAVAVWAGTQREREDERAHGPGQEQETARAYSAIKA